MNAASPDAGAHAELLPAEVKHEHGLFAVWPFMLFFFDVNRFYPKTQLSCTSWARHSHCDSADPPTDWLEVCCVFNRTGRGGVMCDVWCGGPQEGE